VLFTRNSDPPGAVMALPDADDEADRLAA